MSPERVARILCAQGMPADEVRAVLRADDPVFVRRTFELHRERLIERVDEQRRLVARIEHALVS